MSETLLDVGYSILDLMESKQRRSNRGYTIAMVALFALGFLAGRMYEGYAFKGHTFAEHPAPTYKSRVPPEPTPSAPVYYPTPQEQETPDDMNRRGLTTTTSSQLRPIAEESQEYIHGKEQLSPRTTVNKAPPITEWRHGAMDGFTQPATTPKLPSVIKGTTMRFSPDKLWERPKPVATRPRRVNFKKGEYRLR